MPSWIVTVTTEGPGEPADDEALERLLDELVDVAGIPLGTPDAHDGCSWGAGVVVEADSPEAATVHATDLIATAGGRVGLRWFGVASAEIAPGDSPC